MGVKKVAELKKECNSSVANKFQRYQLSCSHCPPNQHENCKRKGRHGKTKPKYKNHRK